METTSGPNEADFSYALFITLAAVIQSLDEEAKTRLRVHLARRLEDLEAGPQLSGVHASKPQVLYILSTLHEVSRS